VKDFIAPSARETSLLSMMALSWRELLQTSMRQTSNAAIQTARLTGSRRRMSSAACASARRFKRIGIVVKTGSNSGQGCPDGDGELGRDLLEFRGLLRGQLGSQESGGVHDHAFDHEFLLEFLHDEFRTGGAAGN